MGGALLIACFAGVFGTDCMPLGISYIKALLDRDVPEVESRVFAYPEALLESLQAQPPDVLLCSNYLWNETLSLHFLKSTHRGKSIVKSISKQGGEGIKAQETVLELNNISRLRVEGTVGAQDLGRLQKGQTCYLQAGAGIVADSDPAREREETLNKARGLLRALEMAEQQL